MKRVRKKVKKFKRKLIQTIQTIQPVEQPSERSSPSNTNNGAPVVTHKIAEPTYWDRIYQEWQTQLVAQSGLPGDLIQLILQYSLTIEGQFLRTSPPIISPMSVAASDYLIAVTGYHANLVHVLRYDDTFTPLQVFGKNEKSTAPGEFDAPYGVGIADNMLYVTDSNNHRIQVFDLFYGKYYHHWGKHGRQVGQLSLPTSLTIRDDEIIIGEWGTDRVSVFNRFMGVFLRGWGKRGDGETEYDNPAALAIANNEIYVADWGNHRVQVSNQKNGNFLREFGNGNICYPRGLCVVGDEIYISDNAHHRIVIYNKSGKFLRSFGNEGSSEGCLQKPWGLTLSSTGELIVCDSENSRLQIFV
jgi:DNA-binding beta-propeller fold protein YncE